MDLETVVERVGLGGMRVEEARKQHFPVAISPGGIFCSICWRP